MELIEQAVFLPAASDGGRRVVASPGVCEADVREIAARSPTEESVLVHGADPTGLYFHPLPSGARAIGRTTAMGRQPGERGERRASTHCLVVRRRTLARFAGNPLALLRAAEAAGLLGVHEELPCRLDAFRLEGRAPIVDTDLLGQLRYHPGPDWMAALVQAAIDAANTAIVDGAEVENVVAGVINCLPPECRMDLSFSIGLRFSSRRPYRLVALPSGTDEPQRMQRLYDVAVLDLAGRPPQPSAPVDSWGSLVHRVLRRGRTSLFACQLARRPLDFLPQDLPVLGLQMLEALDGSAVREDDGAEPAGEGAVIDERWEAEAEAGDNPSRRCGWPTEPVAKSPSQNRANFRSLGDFGSFGISSKPSTLRGSRRRAHGSHPPRPSSAEIAAVALLRPSPPSKDLNASDPEVLGKLERLDDLVFDAISGNRASLDELIVFWPKVRGELGDPLLAESREQYLRYALMSWDKLAQRDGARSPSLAMQSLEVLCVLFGGPIE